MHIKRIHEMIEKLTKCAEMELEKGIDKVDTKEMGEVTDMIKDLAEAEYYAKIAKAMDEADYGEDYDYEGRKGYRGQPRDSRGRYTRRGYEKSMMIQDDEWDEIERMRDLDRHLGRMGYAGGGSLGNSRNTSMNSDLSSSSTRGYNGGNYSSREQRDSREGRSGQLRKSYMEAKEYGKDKQEKMKNLEEYMKELSEDVTEMIQGSSPEEKTMLKNKMQMLMQKIQ